MRRSTRSDSPRSARSFARLFLVLARQLDVGRALGPAPREARARSRRPRRRHRARRRRRHRRPFDEIAGRPAHAALPVAPRVGTRLPRAEEAFVRLRAAAPRHRAIVLPLSSTLDVFGIRLHDVPGRQVLRPRAAGAREHLALVPARSKDRRARPERRRQVDAPQDHGREGRAVVRRRRARARTRPSACSNRSRISTRRRRCARTSRTACARRATCSTASTRSARRSPSPTPTSTRFSPSRRRCRTGSTASTRGRSTTSSTTRWTRSAAPTRDRDVETLSGGERRRVALCRLLLSAPDLLLLDEPTNHLDAESVLWLERFLADYKGTVVAVTHDRYFLDNVAGWILELDRGKGIPFQGNYSSWLEQKQARLAIEEKTESARRRTLARELEWVRQSPKARHAKAKARLGSYEKLLAEEQNVKLDSVEIHIPPGPRLGDVVIDADGVKQGLRRPAPLRGSDLLPAAGGNRRRRRTERRRQDDAVPDDRRRGAARRGNAARRRHRPARLRRPGARRPRPREHGVEGDLRRPRHRSSSARRRSTRASTRAGSTSAAATSRSASPTSRAASGTASTSRSSCARAATSCSSTSRRTTSTSTRCARSRRRCSSSPAAPS